MDHPSMERQDLVDRLLWMKEDGSWRPSNTGKRVDVGEEYKAKKDDAMVIDGDSILSVIEHFPKLQTLELEGNSHSLAFSTKLAKVLATKTRLRRVLFNNMWVGRKIPEIHPALALFAQALLNCDNLVVLDLSDNAVNPDGSTNIAPLLSQCTSLKELYLNNTGVGPAGGKTIGEALMKCYENGLKSGKPYQLEKFVLGRSRLEVEGCTAVSEAFCKIGTLREIRINNSGIFTEAFVPFARAVASNPQLEVIDVSDNHVKTRGGLAIAKALRNCKNMRVFLASDAGLKTRAGTAIVEALGGTSVEVLKLSFNDMGVPVKDAMIKHLKGKAKTYFDVQGNLFGPGGYEAVVSAIGSAAVPEEPMIDSDDEEEIEDDYTEYDDPIPVRVEGNASAQTPTRNTSNGDAGTKKTSPFAKGTPNLSFLQRASSSTTSPSSSTSAAKSSTTASPSTPKKTGMSPFAKGASGKLASPFAKKVGGATTANSSSKPSTPSKASPFARSSLPAQTKPGLGSSPKQNPFAASKPNPFAAKLKQAPAQSATIGQNGAKANPFSKAIASDAVATGKSTTSHASTPTKTASTALPSAFQSRVREETEPAQAPPGKAVHSVSGGDKPIAFFPPGSNATPPPKPTFTKKPSENPQQQQQQPQQPQRQQMGAPTPATPLSLETVAKAISSAQNQPALVQAVLEAYIVHPKPLAHIFFSLCAEPASAQTMAGIHLFLAHVLPIARFGFLNEVFVGLGLLKSEAAFFSRASNAASAEIIPEPMLLAVWLQLQSIVIQEYFAEFRSTLAVVAADDEIKSRSERRFHDFLKSGPYLNSTHPVNAIRRKVVAMATNAQ